MSYIGNRPEITSFTVDYELFSGNSSCTSFVLARTAESSRAIEVVLNKQQLTPDRDYTVTSANSSVNFSVAPNTATNNIVVTYRAPNSYTFN